MFQQTAFQPTLPQQSVDPDTALLNEVFSFQANQPVLPPYSLVQNPVENAMYVERTEGEGQGGVDRTIGLDVSTGLLPTGEVERDPRAVERERSHSFQMDFKDIPDITGVSY